jgi:chaperonin GroES
MQLGEIAKANPGVAIGSYPFFDPQHGPIPIDVKVGDRVLFGKWSGTEVKLDGVEYMIMKESDLMGVLVDAGSSRKAA